ncbi:MAG: hypothetical protein JWN95_3865 [Frankiales bacterium]|nr:hypothetical protein [Frankiales bacterium]
MGGAGVVLALGGLCLVAAAIVFISVSWTRLGLGPRVAVLAAITAVLWAVSVVVSRRGLRASAETLWAISLIDLWLDLSAARHVDLLGLQQLPTDAYRGLAAIVVGGAAIAAASVSRRSKLAYIPVTVQLSIAAAAWVALPAWLTQAGSAAWLELTVAAAGLVGCAVVARRCGLSVTRWACLGGSALTWAGLVGSGLVNLSVTGSYAHQLFTGAAFELPAAAVLALLTAVSSAVLASRVARIVVGTAGLVLTGGIGWLLIDSYLPGEIALAAVLAAVVALTGLTKNFWRRAAELVAVPASAAAVLVILARAIEGVAASLGLLDSTLNGGIWVRALDSRLLSEPGAAQPWPTLLLLATLSGSALLRRVRIAALLRPARDGSALYLTTSALAWLLPLTVAVSLVDQPYLWVGVLGWLLATLAGVGLAARTRRHGMVLAPAGSLGLGLLTALPSDLATIAASAVAVGICSYAARRWCIADSDARQIAELSATGAGVVPKSWTQKLNPTGRQMFVRGTRRD